MVKRLGINDPLNYEFSRFIKPRLWVESGESIVVETEDALSGQIKTENDILDHLNCLIKFGSFKNDSILIKYSYNGEELNDLALSLCTSKERKIE